jgi:amino acid adenylation domain-containing protein
VPELVRLQADEAPGRLALASPGLRLTYAELVSWADHVAARLAGVGVGPEALVAVLMERGPAAVAAMLGTLRAGAAYLPLDPAHPPARLDAMLADAGVAVLLTEPDLAGRAGAAAPALLVDPAGPPSEAAAFECPAIAPGNLAYVIYTSGSSGRPKGVECQHDGLLDLVRWHRAAFGVTPGDRLTWLSGLGFDASVLDLWPALCAGAAVHVPDPLSRLEPERLRDWLLSNRITVAFLSTPMAQQALQLDWPPDAPLRFLLTGGDRLHGRPRPGLPFRLVDNYGPTEVTVLATSGEVAAGPGNGEEPRAADIGSAVRGARVHVLDERLRPVVDGVGELHVAGSGVARGYRGDPALTALRFVPEPDAGRPGSRMYRTGDLAHRLPGGRFEFRGRADGQVKVRGVRIELGDVEAALAAHHSVAQAAAATREVIGRGAWLEAFVVPRPGAGLDVAELAAFMRARLPAPMLPAAIHAVADLPLTPNGKVDRRALLAGLEPELGPAAERGAAAPRTPEEELLASIWAEVLGGEPLGVDDDLLQAGADSLTAARVLSRLRARTVAGVGVEELFERRTIAAQAALLRRAAPPPVPAPEPGPEPAGLSPAQMGMWLLDQVEPGSAAYRTAFALRLEGRLSVEALGRAIDVVASRHPALRSGFPSGAEGPRLVIRPHEAVELPLIDLSGLPPELRAEQCSEAVRAETHRQFDLERDRLFRVRLLRLGSESHLLVVVVHHIVFDAWSADLLLRDLRAAYAEIREGRPPSTPAPAPARARETGPPPGRSAAGVAAQLAYWRRQLEGAPALGPVPGARPRPALPTHAGDEVLATLDRGLAAAVDRLAAEAGVTQFMAHLAGYACLLGRLTGQEDLVIGVPVARRDRPEQEGLVGLFLNVLPLRLRLRAAASFRELLGQARAVTLAALANGDVPFERLVRELAPDRRAQHHPVYQASFVLQNALAGAEPWPGLTVERRFLHCGGSTVDLTLTCEPHGEDMLTRLEFSTDILDRDVATRILHEYEATLASVITQPDRPELRTVEPASPAPSRSR